MTRQEVMSADDKIVAFDFQYELFLLELFRMKLNETVGFEFEEDVHIEHANGTKSYFQVKHTIDSKNLTSKDIDLWKTIWSWLVIICDRESRPTIEEQIKFINDTQFILLTNKKANSRNIYLDCFEQYKKNELMYEELTLLLAELISSNEEKSEIDIKIQEIINYEEQILSLFFKKISFETDFVDIDKQIKIILEEKYVPEKYIETVYNSIYTIVKKRLEKVVKERQHLSFSQAEFALLVQRYSYGDKIRARVFKDIDFSKEEKISGKMLFLRQLEDVEVFNSNEPKHERYILKKYENKLLYEKNKLIWIQDSEIPEEILYEIEEEAIDIWGNKFHKFYRVEPSNEIDKIKKAQELYYEIEETKLDFAIEVEYQKSQLAEGVFLSLSDIPKIGWHFDWEGKYTYEDLQ